MNKILVPLNNRSRLKDLVEAGADEFYMGFHDEEWVKEFGDFTEINRMSGFKKYANPYNLQELLEIAKEIKGYGKDIIDNYSSYGADTDILKLQGLNREDVRFEVSGNDLIVKVLKTGETVTIKEYFRGSYYSLEKLVFEDGTEMSFKDVVGSELVREGGITADNITLTNTNGVVSLYGNSPL